MAGDKERMIVVTGATGLQGGAVARHLLSHGWRVRALTRNPGGAKAQALSALGAEVVQGDMAEPGSLAPVFEGAYGVFSVQNPMTSGVEGEIRAGKNVAEAAKNAGARHLVYASTGTGAEGTGIPSWESKLVIEEHMRSLRLPVTILRPKAFLDLMTEKKFFPPVAIWQVMPRLMGSTTKIGWIGAEDAGFIAARVFAEPERFLNQELHLSSDVKSIAELRGIYQEVFGKSPSRFPMPVWLFERFGLVGKDLSAMWRWLRTGTVDWSTETALAIHPRALDAQAWLEKQNH